MKDSLKIDFENLLLENLIADKVVVHTKSTKRDITFKSDLKLQIRKNNQKTIVHGIPQIGTRSSSESECVELAEEGTDTELCKIIAEIENKTSEVLNLQSAQLEIKGREFYSVHSCHKCASKGRLRCGQCQTTGKQKCSVCSASGLQNCTSCHGHGTKICSYCSAGKIKEFNHTLSDSIFDTVTKNHGHSVDRNCNHCGGKSVMECSYCKGSKKVRCANCSGEGYTTCNSCNGNGEKICSSCGGNGQNSRVVHSTVSLSSTQNVIESSKYDQLVKKSMLRNPDDFFQCMQIHSVKNVKTENITNWHLTGVNEFVELKIVDPELGEIQIGRFSNENNTMVSSKNLDHLFVEAAKFGISKIKSLKDFKENASQLPGILRIMFGENSTKSETDRLHSMYEGVITEDGMKSILAMKEDFTDDVSNKIESRIFWPVYLSSFFASLMYIPPLFDYNIYIEIIALSILTYIISTVISVLIAEFFVKKSTKIQQ